MIYMFVGIGFSGSRGGDKPFSPALVSGLQLWLDSEYGVLDGSGNQVTTDGQKVATWQDKSGKNRHAVQGTISKQPTYRTGVNGRNGKPALEFSNASVSGLIASNVTFNPYTIFTVIVPSSTINTTMYGLVGGASSTNLIREADAGGLIRYASYHVQSSVACYRQFTLSTASISPQGGWLLFAHKSDGTPASIESVGANQGHFLFGFGKNSTRSANIGGSFNPTSVSATMGIGCDTGGLNSMTGKIAEVIVYNTMMTSSDQKLIEAYLANKYAFTLLG